ncbi:hypothetical protein [Ramlibacter albus]|uniref:Uncharacterized protein n=1 Tax=Ramlibacter albus TaxID=2079448 RepID=A0A923S4G8_9BURK|nr:hypothetical protein [Ramlibacter albus]MBC5767584.1 hypothetical protein [Ramlibacter albus]
MNQPLVARPQPEGDTSKWLVDVQAALQSGDDGALWRLVDQHHDPAVAHHSVATLAARISYRVEGRARFSEMFLLPVIDQPGGKVIGDAVAFQNADFCINEALDGWLPPKTRKTVFRGVRPYDWIGAWRPTVLQGHLHSTVPGSELTKLNFLTETIELPPDVPRLGFVCMVLTSERGWPQLPPVDTLRDNRFKSVVSFALQNGKSAAPVVLPPDRMQCAVPDGICLWLHQMHQVVPITGWIALPLQASSDVVKITLALASEDVPFSQFTLRKHQLGMQGLDEVLAMLNALAPMLDQPMDIPSKRAMTTLDLT